MKLRTLPLCVAFSVAGAQGNNRDDDNPSVEIQSCNALSCIDNSNGVCQAGGIRATGVGIAGEVISTANTSLSLTLVDDGDSGGVIAGSRGYQFSTQILYAGIPQTLDNQDQPTGCALMAQYQGSTFPDDGSTSNTTECGNIIPDFCRRNLADMIQDFEFLGNDTTQSDRCEALTQFVSAQIRQELMFCGSWLAGFTNITGGTIFGPGAASEATQLQEEGCQPVVPEQRSLYKVTEMTQLLYAGDEELLKPGDESDDQLPRVGAARSGITPVITVLYDGDQSPDVQFACMRTFAADGGEMPDQLNFESIAERNRVVAWLVAVVAAVCVSLV